MDLRKIVVGDLVAIALASIVSLLFAREVCFFVDAASKKETNYATAPIEEQTDGDEEVVYQEAWFGTMSPIEITTVLDSIQLSRAPLLKSWRVVLIDSILTLQNFYLPRCNLSSNKTPSVVISTTPIPIAQRKLLI